MKKYMDNLVKLDSKALEKRASDLRLEIVEARRGVASGEVQNNQVIKQKRQELARVNTLLSNPIEEDKSAVNSMPKEKK